MMRNSHLTLASAVLAATILWSPTVSAGPIDPGFDLFSTESGTIEIPGLGLGPTDLKGIPGVTPALNAGPFQIESITSPSPETVSPIEYVALTPPRKNIPPPPACCAS